MQKSLELNAPCYVLVDYPGVMHAFTNPEADVLGPKFGLPLKYDPEADEDCATAADDPTSPKASMFHVSKISIA